MQIHRIPVPARMLAEAKYPSWIPAALSAAAWAEAVAWTDDDTTHTGVPQDENGRLWDVVWMARPAATRPPSELDEEPVPFTVCRVPRDARPGEEEEIEATPLRLVLVFGYDGDDRPIFTIMLPDEA